MKSAASRLLRALGVLWGVATLVFFLFQVLPGDPARMLLDQREDSEQLALIRQKLGFDQPVGVQYLYFLNDVSPLSWHSHNPENYTYPGNHRFTAKDLFPLMGRDI